MISASKLISVTGKPGKVQVATIKEPLPRRLRAGGFILAKPSARNVQGLAGQVRSITHVGHVGVVRVVPAALTQVYSSVNVKVHQKVQPNQIKELPGPRDRARPDAKVPGLNFNPARAAFTCDKPSANAVLAFDVDLTDFTVDFSLNANPFHAQLSTKLTIRPKLSADIGFSGSASCSLSAGRLLGVSVPVPGFPAAQLVVKPQLKITASGQATLGATWNPTVVAGFSATPTRITPINSFDAGSLTPHAALAGSVTAFIGVSVGLTFSGFVTVSGDFGPYAKLSGSTTDDCYKISVGLQASLDVDVDLIKHVKATLATGVFGDRVSNTNCTKPTIATKSLPNAAVGTTYAAVLTTDDHRVGTWTVPSGSLPPGLALPGYQITGRPTTAATYKFTLLFTDAHRQTAQLLETLTVLPAATTPPSGGGGASGGAKVDIVFTVDTTGSMSPYIQSAISSASAVVDALNSSKTDYRVGVVDYKDQDNACGDYASVVDLPFSNNRTAILAAIQSLAGKVDGGCDTPEDVYSGVNTALNFPWRNGARKSVVVLGDAPGHDPEQVSGLTQAAVVAHAAAVDPAQVYGVLIGDDPEAHTFDQSLADATGGMTFDATSDPSAVGPALVAAIGTIINAGPSLQLTEVSGRLGGPFTARLVSGADGSGLVNRVIDFQVPTARGLVDVCSGLTDVDGYAVCTPDASQSVAALTALLVNGLRFVATYAGTDTEQSASATVAVGH